METAMRREHALLFCILFHFGIIVLKCHLCLYWACFFMLTGVLRDRNMCGLPIAVERGNVFSYYFREFNLSEEWGAMNILGKESDFFTTEDMELACGETSADTSFMGRSPINMTDIDLQAVLKFLMHNRTGGRTLKRRFRNVLELPEMGGKT